MLLIVTKGMKLRKIILITCLILVANQLKAQILKSEILSAGITHQIGLSSNNFSQTGLKINLSHLRYAVNTGVLFLSDKDFSTFFINGEFNVLAWHHAYLAHRFTPVLGAQLEQTSQENTTSFTILPKVGIKGSYDRFIFDISYLHNRNRNQLQVGLSYVIWIGPNCTMKRVKEFNPPWESQLNF